ncbi:hypothetical protein [Rheinheimera sp. 1928-s]|uniref:hypothetical protein n=1 Tax=Rheinheimera sp. 1928-s TaxID=3033803 RepID=UPI00262C56FF|nr:hypothetical protein [Rheinheimera sp. 1928-s]MDF3123488.1 hypothetical protein [Rheinheimera sp. 1928-s]
MIYHGLGNDLINFAFDPIKYRNVLGVQASPTVRVFNKCLNIVMPYKTDIEEFEEFLFGIILQAEEQINKLRNGPPSGMYDRDKSNLINKIKDYLRIDVKNSRDGATDPVHAQAILDYTDNQLLVTFGYNVDRLSERYGIKREHFLLIDGAIVISAMMLSEIYVFVKSGYISIRKLKGGFELTLKDSTVPYHKALGVSELLEKKSTDADEFTLYSATSMMNSGYVPLDVAEHTIDEVFDKVLSIQPKYLSDEAKASEHYRFIRECVAIMAFTQCFKLRGQDIPAKFFFDNQLCRPESLTFICNNLRSLNSLKGNHFSALDFDGRSFKPGDLEFSIATRHFVFAASELLSTKVDTKNELIKFGDVFEKDYIYRRIQSINPARYQIYPSLNPNNNAEIKGYDIDLVIEDKMFDQFYFVQVKYRTKWLPKYYSERYWELNKGLLQSYERQLRIFKDNLNHQSIRKKLSQQKYKGLERATDENSHFVFLHNIPFLNFYELDGIYFYEWNLFRNLMQGAKVYFTQYDTKGAETRNPFMLHDIVAALEAYIDDKNAKTSIRPDLEAYTNSLVQLKVKSHGKTTCVDMPLV